MMKRRVGGKIGLVIGVIIFLAAGAAAAIKAADSTKEFNKNIEFAKEYKQLQYDLTKCGKVL